MEENGIGEEKPMDDSEPGLAPSKTRRKRAMHALQDTGEQLVQLVELRQKLFGSWEMNWVAFNQGRDITLARDSVLDQLPFFMYPQAEVAGRERDSLEPAEFTYTIASSQLVGTGIKF